MASFSLTRAVPLIAPSHPLITAEVIHDSRSPYTGVRLTTLRFCLPKFILAQVNTNRTPSKSVASSRAMPVAVLLDQAFHEPFRPMRRLPEGGHVPSWNRNQKGMEAAEPLTGWRHFWATLGWRIAWAGAVVGATMQRQADVAKETANRPLDPYVMSQGIMSSTSWGNQLMTRMPKDAQPEYRSFAWAAAKAIRASTPVEREYHWPWVEDVDPEEARAACMRIRTTIELPPSIAPIEVISAARLARVSTLTHDKRRDLEADARLGLSTLLAKHHVAPFEHVAIAREPGRCAQYGLGNFTGGWLQARKRIPGEAHAGYASDDEAMQAVYAMLDAAQA